MCWVENDIGGFGLYSPIPCPTVLEDGLLQDGAPGLDTRLRPAGLKDAILCPALSTRTYRM